MDNDLLSKLTASDPIPEPEARLEELSVDASQAHELAKNDLDFLAAIAMPEVFKYCFPLIFQAIWQWLLQFTFKLREFPKLAIGLPRGFGKTTFIKIYVLFVILFTDRQFILIVSATSSLAENIISDICDMLDHPNIKKIFGNWRLGLEKDTLDLKKFGFRGRNIIIAGIGVGGSLRGLNIKNERPDVMIFEDIQTREAAESQVQSDAIERWLYATAMKAKSPDGCIFIFVANMYPTKWSILRKMKKNPTWIKFIVGGILKDGTSLWEELQPVKQLLEEFESDLAAGHPEIFYSEVLNDEEANVNTHIDLSKLPEFTFTENDPAAGKFVVIDPATGKQNGDAVSVGYFEVHNASPVLWEVEEGRFSPGDTVRRAIRFCLEKGCRLVAVESNAYQSTFNYWARFICEQLQIQGIEFVEIYSGTTNKIARILNMFKSLKAGEIFYHPRTAAQVNSQITQFNALKNDNVDGILDLLTYSPRVIEEFGMQIQAYTEVEAQEWRNAKVVEDNCTYSDIQSLIALH